MLTYGLPHLVIQSVMLGEWRQSSRSTASTYFIHIFYIILCILVGTKVLHTFLLFFTPKARVITVIFQCSPLKITEITLAFGVNNNKNVCKTFVRTKMHENM